MMSSITGDAHRVSKNSRNNAVCTALPSPRLLTCNAARVVANGASGPARPRVLTSFAPSICFLIPGTVNNAVKNMATPQFRFLACSRSAFEGDVRSPRVFTSFDRMSTTCLSAASSCSIEIVSLGD